MNAAGGWPLFAIVVLFLVVGACTAAATCMFAYRLRRILRQQSKRLVAVDNSLSMLKVSISQQNARVVEILESLRRSHPFAFAAGEALQPSDIIVDDAVDTYEGLDQNWLSIRDTSGRLTSAGTIEGERQRTAVIVLLGQSNIANHGAGKYVAKHRVDNFNIYDGKCYHAMDPLLGASGDGGNFATRLGDKLIEAKLFDRVILAPIAMGGTTVEQWADEGLFNRRIPVLIRRLYDAGLGADFIFWQQGEGNSGIADLSGRQYRKNLLEVIRTFRWYGVNAPFFVSLTTFTGGPRAGAENIRAGQKGVVEPTAKIYQGADTDTVGVEHRWDSIHFNEEGLDMVAALWLAVLANYQRAARLADGTVRAQR